MCQSCKEGGRRPKIVVGTLKTRKIGRNKLKLYYKGPSMCINHRGGAIPLPFGYNPKLANLAEFGFQGASKLPIRATASPFLSSMAPVLRFRGCRQPEDLEPKSG